MYIYIRITRCILDSFPPLSLYIYSNPAASIPKALELTHFPRKKVVMSIWMDLLAYVHSVAIYKFGNKYHLYSISPILITYVNVLILQCFRFFVEFLELISIIRLSYLSNNVTISMVIYCWSYNFLSILTVTQNAV
jgi:hypothetical protein